MLSKMQSHEPGRSLQVLGSFVQIGRERSQEWDAVRRSCWAAFHMRLNFRRARGHVVQRILMRHLSRYPMLSWRASTGYWTKRELAEARTMQLRMFRCTLNREDIQTFFRRTARCAEQVMIIAKVPRWG